ncbi:MAG: hypothetical protein WCC92_12100 [Candidatus Korobacteraceae bacterium]
MALLHLIGEPSKVVPLDFPERFHQVRLLASVLFPTSTCGAGSCLPFRRPDFFPAPWSATLALPDADLFPWYQVKWFRAFGAPFRWLPPAAQTLTPGTSIRRQRPNIVLASNA